MGQMSQADQIKQLREALHECALLLAEKDVREFVETVSLQRYRLHVAYDLANKAMFVSQA
jgi:hypothetical protein